MAKNMLKLQKEDRRLEDGFLDGPSPAVFEYDNELGRRVYVPTYGVIIENIDGQPYVGIANINGTRYYRIEDPKDVTVDEAKGEITFSSYGKIYRIRAFQDSDGLWASRLQTFVPAQALEERFMAEVTTAFSPNAPADDENLYAAVDGDTDEVKYLVYSTESGMYTRSNRGWFKVPKDDESLDDLEVYEVSPKFIKIYDMAEGNDDQLLADDVREYEVDFRGALTAAGLVADADYGDECPPATLDIELNLKNRQNAIDKIGYGPLNPNEPNEEFWQTKAERWSVTPDEAKKSLCGNCVMFIRTPKVLDCIAQGLEAGDSGSQDAWDAIDKAELGYCEALDFKCAASRTCDAWVVGGPITEEKEEDNA
jgi:hypothetical protein